jgi:hypothetical protein
VAAAEAAVTDIVAAQRARAARGEPAFSPAPLAALPALPVPRNVAEDYPALLRDDGAALRIGDNLNLPTGAGASEAGTPWTARASGYPRHLLRHPALWQRAPLVAAPRTAAGGVARSGSELWYLPDPRFRTPRAMLRVILHSPLAYASPEHVVLSRLLLGLLSDGLDELTYAAQLAEASAEVDSLKAGIEIRVGGLSHKLPRLVTEAVRMLLTVRSRFRAALAREASGDSAAAAAAGEDPRERDMLRRFTDLRSDVVRYFSHMHYEPADSAAFLRLLVLQQERFPADEVVAAAVGAASAAPADVAAALSAAAATPGAPLGTHITPQRFLEFLDAYVDSGLAVQMFVHGNLTPEAAVELFDSVAVDLLGHQRVETTEEDRAAAAAEPTPVKGPRSNPDPILRLVRYWLVLFRSTSFFLICMLYVQFFFLFYFTFPPQPARQTTTVAGRVRNPTEPASCVSVYHAAGRFSPRLAAAMAVLDHTASEPAFNQLRTKEQLGYSVSVDCPTLQTLLGLAVEVTSSSHSAQHVLDSIEAFLGSFRETLVLTWRQHAASLLNAYFAPDVAFGDVTTRIWVRTHSGPVLQRSLFLLSRPCSNLYVNCFSCDLSISTRLASALLCLTEASVPAPRCRR